MEVLRAVFRLTQVRRAPGNAGKLDKIVTTINMTDTNVYITPSGETCSFPGNMHLVVSAFAPESLLFNVPLFAVRFLIVGYEKDGQTYVVVVFCKCQMLPFYVVQQ
jgi:hypothetical protein